MVLVQAIGCFVTLAVSRGGKGVEGSVVSTRLVQSPFFNFVHVFRALKKGQGQRVAKEQLQAGAQPLESVAWGGVPWQIRFAFN